MNFRRYIYFISLLSLDSHFIGTRPHLQQDFTLFLTSCQAPWSSSSDKSAHECPLEANKGKYNVAIVGPFPGELKASTHPKQDTSDKPKQGLHKSLTWQTDELIHVTYWSVSDPQTATSSKVPLQDG